MGPVARWVIHHDDSMLFIASYVTLAVVLALFSLFWLFVVVMIHFGFEWFKQSRLHESPRRMIGEVLWELKLDVGLITFALALTLYLPYALGMLGLGAASRAAVGAQAAARSGTRIAAVQRTLRAILLSLDDAFLVMGGIVASKETDPEPQEEASGPIARSLLRDSEQKSWAWPWSWGDWGTLAFSLGSLLMILLAPVLTGETPGSTLSILLDEMHPLP